MKTKIIDGKKLSEKIQEQLKEKVKALPRRPKLAVILVGDNPASVIYVNHKKKVAEKIGVEANLYQLSPVMTQDALIAFIQELNKNNTVDGILVQLPLPAPFEEETVLDAIDPNKDVDGLTKANLGNLFVGQEGLRPCTPLACMELIHTVCDKLSGKNVVIVGRSRLVGKPLAQLLLNENCTVTQAHSKTQNLPEVCRQADILIAATGRPGLITKNHVKKGAILIDVGITRLENNKITGDISFEEMIGHADAITPVPGGVGPMTVTMLLSNVITSFSKKGLPKA